MEYASIALALCLSWTWAWRGGSIPFMKVERRYALPATPLALLGALLLGVPQETFWDTLMIILGSAAFLGASLDGWGRQMDLGRNDKPDDETGYWIRDWFFNEKSSYRRDLTGLFMRFAQFYPTAIILGFVHPLLTGIGLVMAIGAPLMWVVEDALYWRKGKVPSFAFVEFATGSLLAAVTTALVVTL